MEGTPALQCGVVLTLEPPIGHIQQINHQTEVGELDAKWVQEYGTVWRTKGVMGVSEMPISLPISI